MRQSLTPSRVCELLNEALRLDPDAIDALFRHRVPCNESLAAHPSIQVTTEPTVGLLGLLNGLFGIQPATDLHPGFGPISAVVAQGRIVEFVTTPTSAEVTA